MMVPFIKHSNRTWPFQWERPLQMDAMEELTHCQIRWGGAHESTAVGWFQIYQRYDTKNGLRWPVDQYL